MTPPEAPSQCRRLEAGAAVADITPHDVQFLYGYPHVARYSTGVHDPLISSALYLCDGVTKLMFISNDVIFIGKATAQRARRAIADATGIPESNIVIAATHTHSGPVTVDYLSNEADPVVPKVDQRYLASMERRIVDAAVSAWRGAMPAQLGLEKTRANGIGTNRRDPDGPSDPEVPVLLVRNADGSRNIACMIVCSMHPTVLHEDSTLISADFPGMARQCLQENLLGPECPVLHFTGPAGNQSPRYMTHANTFEEAFRLGTILAKAVGKVVPDIRFDPHITLSCERVLLELTGRVLPSLEQAEANLAEASEHLRTMRSQCAPRQLIRTAECDLFGAEETVALARAAKDGRVTPALASCTPAEIQLLCVNQWKFIAWPGEIFVEYALDVKNRHSDTFVISLANGELQGYIVTEEAAREGGYEAANALFGYPAGSAIVAAAEELLRGAI